MTDSADAIIERALARLEREGLDALDTICAEHPDHAEVIRRRAKFLSSIGFLRNDHGVPTQLGDFRPLERIGSGGMGVVYRAKQLSLDREVALKIVRPDQLYFPGARERFAREVEAIARLHHPNIVPIFSVGAEGAVPYFAMQLVSGPSIEEWLLDQASELSPRELASANRVRQIAAMARDIANALAHAHRAGVIHRDVKPSNLMIDDEGRILLMDFGLASTGGSDTLTRTGALLGSLPYMAPEQLEGHSQAVGPQSDVYALGAVLYEMLSLEAPFDNDDGLHRLRSRILRGDAIPLRRRLPKLPWELSVIVAVCMDPAPRRRYATADELAADLDRFLMSQPIHARRPGLGLRGLRAVQRNPIRSTVASVASLALVVGPLLYSAGASSQQEETRATLLREQKSDDRTKLTAAELALRNGRTREFDALLSAIPQERRDWIWGHLALRGDRSARILAHGLEGVRALAFVSPGLVLAALDAAGTVHLLDFEGTIWHRRLRAPSGRYCGMSALGSGRQLALATDRGRLELRKANSEIERVLSIPVGECRLAEAHGARTLVVSYANGALREFTTPSGEELGSLPPGLLAFAEVGFGSCVQGKSLVVQGRDNRLYYRELPLRTAKRPAAVRLGPTDSALVRRGFELIHNPHFDPLRLWALRWRGGELATYGAGKLSFWKLAESAKPSRLDLESRVDTDLRPYGTVTALHGTNGGIGLSGHESGAVIKWHRQKAEHETYYGHRGAVTALAWSRSHEFWMASAATDGTIRLWRPHDLIARDRGLHLPLERVASCYDRIMTVAIDAKSETEAHGYPDGVIEIRDSVTGLPKSTSYAQRSSIRALSFSADAQSIVSAAADGTIAVHATRDGALRTRITPAKHFAYRVCFGQDSSLLSLGDDATLRRWSLSGQQLASVSAIDLPAPVTRLSFRGGVGSLRCANGARYEWRLGEQLLRHVIDDPGARLIHKLRVSKSAFVFSPDQSWLALAKPHGGLQIVNVASGREHAQLGRESYRELLWDASDERIVALSGQRSITGFRARRPSWKVLRLATQILDAQKLLHPVLYGARLETNEAVRASPSLARAPKAVHDIVEHCMTGLGEEIARFRIHARRTALGQRARLSDFAAAEAALDRVLSVEPRDRHALCTRALVRLRRNEVGKAAVDARSALIAVGDKADPWPELVSGLVLAASGHTSEARTRLTRAEQLCAGPRFSSDPGAQQLLAELRERMR